MVQIRFDHIGIAVRSTDDALKKYVSGLGGEVIFSKQHDPVWNFLWSQIRFADIKFEFLEPMGDGFVKTFLDQRGEGIHHVTFYVDDLEAVTKSAEEKGFSVVDRLIQDDYKTAFLSPKTTNGVLIQFIEKPIP